MKLLLREDPAVSPCWSACESQSLGMRRCTIRTNTRKYSLDFDALIINIFILDVMVYGDNDPTQMRCK